MASTSALVWEVPVGAAFSASLVDPAGLTDGTVLGARIEMPVTRGIAANWMAGILSGGIWTVTMTAPVQPGPYEFVWRTNDAEPPEFETMVPIVIVAGGVTGQAAGPYPNIDRDAVRPTVSDVAKYERSRTILEGGAYVDTFQNESSPGANDATRPDADAVEGIIDEAMDDVLSQLHYAFNPDHYGMARRAVVLTAALLIEGSFYREQADDRVVGLWQQMLATTVQGLRERIAEELHQQNLLGTMEPRTPTTPWLPRYLS